METTANNINAPSADESVNQSAKKMTMIIYALQASAFILGITMIVAIVLNYVKKSDVQGTWLESHFRWQIKTFWFGTLGMVIGALTSVFLVGYLVLVAATVWIIYRIVVGWLKLSEGKEMYV